MQIALLIAIVVVGIVLVLMKLDFIVFDRNVFGFQISHIRKRGSINNLREYNAILNAVEERFEDDNEGAATDSVIKELNTLLADFHRRTDARDA